ATSFDLSDGCLTYKHPNTSTVFAFIIETLFFFFPRWWCRFTRPGIFETARGALANAHAPKIWLICGGSCSATTG
ncbi:hypothetical protein ABLN72_17905, partial [Mycobacterium tuberculosis]